MDLEKLLICIKIEELHRFVFDNIYVQKRSKYDDVYSSGKEDSEILDEYYKLYREFPNFRKFLVEFLSSLHSKYRRYKH